MALLGLHRHYRHRFCDTQLWNKKQPPFHFPVWLYSRRADSSRCDRQLHRFPFAKTTKLNPLRTAITVFAVVHAALLLLIAVIASSVGPIQIGQAC